MAFWKHDGEAEAGAEAALPAPGAEGSDVLLGPGVELDGRLTFPGTIRVDGTFRGSLAADGAVVVGDRARLEADVTGGDVIVHGAIEGSIRARNTVEIHPRARVRGEVEAPSLSIEKGAVFEGRSRVSASASSEAEPVAGRGATGREAEAPAHA